MWRGQYKRTGSGEAGEGHRGRILEGLLNRVKKFRLSWLSAGMLLSAGIHGWTFAFIKSPMASGWRMGEHHHGEQKKIREAVAVVLAEHHP